MDLDVRADAELQIVRSRIAGEINGAVARELARRAKLAAQELNDPSSVRLLSDGSCTGKADAEARRLMLEDSRDRTLYRHALWGAPAPLRIFFNIYLSVAGLYKVRFFETETEALVWLLE